MKEECLCALMHLNGVSVPFVNGHLRRGVHVAIPTARQKDRVPCAQKNGITGIRQYEKILMKLFKLFIPFFLLFCSFSNQMLAVTHLSQISKADKEKIEKLLSYLFLDEGFSYVLFGSKPMSTIGHDKNTPASYQELYPHPLFELESWWQTWEKYSHLFSMKEFFLFAQNGDEWFEVFLINKSNALKVIEENLTLFRDKIGTNFSSSEILEHIVSSRNVFRDGLNKSHALLGLLLGYGKQNAVGFEKYFSKNRKLHFLSFAPRNSAEVVHLEMDVLAIPSFSSFSNKETNRIVKKYNQERDRIMEIYSKGDFLETTLNRLASHQE